MSVYRSHGDVGEATTTFTLSSFDAQNTGIIEILEYPSYNNSLRSSSAITARNFKRSVSRKSLYVRLWARVTNPFVDWWMGELLAILLSIIAFLTIIVILREFDDHTLPKLPRNIPLSFVISTLAAVSKSSLLCAVASAFGQFKWLWMSSKQRRLQDLQVFDEASRGPLGATKLLISRKGLSWASIGAVVTIFCFIFDPFIQGLISISERVVYKDNPASLLKRAESYPDISTSFDDYGNWIANYPLLHAIDDAIFNPNPLSETQPLCPTGNCTWPPFTSLGFCSKCEDISQSLQNGSTFFDKQSDCDDCLTRNNTLTNYIYTIPELNDQVLLTVEYNDEGQPLYHRSFSSSFFRVYEVPAFFVIPLFWNSTTGFNFTDGTSVLNPLVLFIRTSTHYADAGNVVAADLCALSFCAQKRNIFISLNQLSSTILQTVFSTYEIFDDLIEGLSFIGDDFNMTYPSLVNLTAHLDDYAADIKYRKAFLEGLIGSLRGNLTVHPDTENIVQATSNIIGGFNASSNISMTMDNIATTLTNWARDSSNVTIAGQAGYAELYVDVNWLWIILPALLVIAGTIFLMLAMYETKILGARIWKTSELALLFHGLEESDQELNRLLRSSEMEHVASNTKVKVAKTSGGRWMLRREKIPIKFR